MAIVMVLLWLEHGGYNKEKGEKELVVEGMHKKGCAENLRAYGDGGRRRETGGGRRMSDESRVVRERT